VDCGCFRVTLLAWHTCVLALGLGAQNTPLHPSTPPTATSACTLPGLSLAENNTFTDAQLLAAYNTQADLVRSLRTYAMVRGKSEKEQGQPAKHPGAIGVTTQLRAPDKVRMTAIIPFSERSGFDMASDGSKFRLLVPVDHDREFLVGSVDAPAVSPNPRENLRPQPLIDALLWSNGTLTGATEGEPANHLPRILTIQLPKLRGVQRTAKVEFDLKSGTVASLSIYGPRGWLIGQVRYSDWEEVPNQGNGGAAACYPRRIALEQPEEHLLLDIRILQIDLNPSIPEESFRLNPPRGVPVTKLNLSGEKDAR
jgi:hypothetical protein